MVVGVLHHGLGEFEQVRGIALPDQLAEEGTVADERFAAGGCRVRELDPRLFLELPVCIAFRELLLARDGVDVRETARHLGEGGVVVEVEPAGHQGQHVQLVGLVEPVAHDGRTGVDVEQRLVVALARNLADLQIAVGRVAVADVVTGLVRLPRGLGTIRVCLEQPFGRIVHELSHLYC